MIKEVQVAGRMLAGRPVLALPGMLRARLARRAPGPERTTRHDG
jgi:hypothetical protein